MSKLDLSQWKLDSKFNDDEHVAAVTIHLQYPDIKPLLPLSPKERVKAIDLHYRSAFKELLTKADLIGHDTISNAKRPIGLKGTLTLDKLKKMSDLEMISYIIIHDITNAELVENEVMAPKQRFYCVKMTVVADIEGVESKTQTVKERMMLIKASSFDDAYEKLELQGDNYAEPYLNTDGRLVSWRVESFDDCFETDIDSINDLDNEEGVEVYSKWRLRRRRK
jgi:hypothetical protein